MSHCLKNEWEWTLKWDGRRLVIACLCIQCTQHLFIRWWMKNDMQQVYRALSQPMMSTHICNSDGFIPLKQSIFSSSASSNLQISFDLFDNHVLPTLKHDHWIKHAWRQMDDWCDSGWMNVAQNLETILQICDVLQSADAAKAANAWGWGGIDRFEELICENCDRVLHNYYFAKVKTYLQNIYGAA